MGATKLLTLDDIFALKYLTHAQISPDGSEIAFVAARDHTEGEQKLPASNIWLVPWDGSAPASQFTHSQHADTHPRWSPDGSSLAFLSEQTESIRVYHSKQTPAKDAPAPDPALDALGSLCQVLFSSNRFLYVE